MPVKSDHMTSSGPYIAPPLQRFPGNGLQSFRLFPLVKLDVLPLCSGDCIFDQLWNFKQVPLLPTPYPTLSLEYDAAYCWEYYSFCGDFKKGRRSPLQRKTHLERSHTETTANMSPHSTQSRSFRRPLVSSIMWHFFVNLCHPNGKDIKLIF